MNTSPHAVLPCPPGLREMALRDLHRNLPEELQVGLVQAIGTTGFKEETAWSGFWSDLEARKISGWRDCGEVVVVPGIFWDSFFPSTAEAAFRSVSILLCNVQLILINDCIAVSYRRLV